MTPDPEQPRSKVSKHAIIRAACALLRLIGMLFFDLLGLAWEKIRGRDWR